MQGVLDLIPITGEAMACRVLGTTRGELRRQRLRARAASLMGPPAPRQMRTSALALSCAERQLVLNTLGSERFVDVAPASVHATLLDEGRYLGSVRTMYRLLLAHSGCAERRRQRRHTAYAKPELLATGPNQVWSWDITKLKGPAKWTYFHLYVILDIFSRYVVGWLIAPRECAGLAAQMIEATAQRQNIAPGTLSLHADRGASMRSKPVASLLLDLDITKSHSRPYTSDDNPYSEAQFKTLKYRPDFPERFGCIEDARAHCQTFFAWYNDEHRHSGIAHMTPHSVHHGLAQDLITTRQQALDVAFAAHPGRFKGKRPAPAKLPTAAWINPPPEKKTETKISTETTPLAQ
jgi:transposase InsO family protein